MLQIDRHLPRDQNRRHSGRSTFSDGHWNYKYGCSVLRTVCTRHHVVGGHSFPFEFSFSFAPYALHRILAASFASRRGYGAPTAETTDQFALLVELSHRRRQSREGGLEHHTSQSRLWLRWCPPHNDQGTFAPPLPRDPQVHTLSGFDGKPTGLRRARAILC